MQAIREKSSKYESGKLGPMPVAVGLRVVWSMPAEISDMVGTTPAAPTVPDFGQLIVSIARTRDRIAFENLFDYFAPRLISMFKRMGTPNQRAEELTQDTLLAVWNKAHLFDPAGTSASGWVYRIATNLRIDSLRRDRHLAKLATDPSDELEQSHLPDSILMSKQAGTKIGAAVALLSAEQQQVIGLSFFEDTPHAEIAARLQLPLGTVKSRLRLAMKRLRTLLEAESL